MNNVYTENLADIMACHTERLEVQEIITAWNEKGLPTDFYDEGVKFAFNKNSGCVFLVNDDYQCCMMNGDKLDIWYSSPYSGHEGFIDELFDEYMSDKDLWHIEDAEWLLDIKSNLDL